MLEEIPDEGRKIAISERSLKVLLEMAHKADAAMLCGSCQGKNLHYCPECWAMEEAHFLLLGEDE